MSIRLMLIGTMISLGISGCCTPQYLVQELPLPPSIPLEKRLTQAELKDISDTLYQKIVRLDKQRVILRDIIKTTIPTSPHGQ